MRTKIFLLLLVVLLLLGCSAKPNNPPVSVQSPPVVSSSQPEINTVTITSSGFSPNTLTVKEGEPVNFINKDTALHWPASGPHPVHTGYPETGGCIGSKFDACHGLAQNEVWTFTFNIKGSWEYHDHLHPSNVGTIVVE